MANKTSIEWTDATWSPIRYRVRKDAAEIATAKGYTSLGQIASKMAGHVGQHCEPVSPGCEHCYAGTNNHRCLPGNGTGLPYDRRSRDLVEPFIDEKALMLPLKWKQGRKIFVENQSDLFGEWVHDEMIDRVFAVMALCPQHTFQVLTKRAKRMREYLCNSPGFTRSIRWAEAAMSVGSRRVLWRCQPADRGFFFGFTAESGDDIRDWPGVWGVLPNVWLGVSVEDQQRADERIPDLLATPAAVRFLSVEPLLGAVDLARIPCKDQGWITRNALSGRFHDVPFDTPLGARIMVAVDTKPHIDWVIVGGESGPGARPCNTEWVRSIVKQCGAAGVACFVKQLGAHVIQGGQRRRKADKKGGDMHEWEHDLRVRQMPGARA